MKVTEHRKMTRSACAVPVEGCQGSIFEHVSSVDISSGGMGLISRKKLSPKQRIAVEVDIGPGYDPIVMLAEVRWASPAESADNYRAGMKFIKVLSPGSRSRLTQYFGGQK